MKMIEHIIRRADWHRLIYLLPVLLPVMCAVFGIVAVVLLLLGQFKTVLVWPLGLAAAGVVAATLYRSLPKYNITKTALWSTLFILGLTVVWVAVNFVYSSQHVYTNRDPGLYVNGGLWLMDHEQMQIPKSPVFQDSGDVLTETTSGFGESELNNNEMYAQGAHLVPALIGLAGRIGGEGFLLKASPLLGGLALLGLYGFARMITRQRWAIVATAAFAVSLPAIYFSRDTYSEMLAAAFVFASLALFVEAVNANRKSIWLIAGIMAGASQLVRVDAILSMAGMVVAVVAYLLFSEKSERKDRIVKIGIFLLAMAIVTVIGLFDLYLLASGYFSDLRKHITLELVGIGVLSIVGCLIVILGWRTKLVANIDRLTSSWRARWAAVGVFVISAYLALRPLWLVSRNEDMKPVSNTTEAVQALNHLPIDGLRTYGEYTANWLVWYIGPILTVLAVVGIALTAYRAMKSKDLRWLAMLGVIFGAAIVYLNKPAITPDQIWASRRLLPVVIPGVALFGVLGLEWLENRKKIPWGINKTVLISVLGTLAIVGPLFTAVPFISTRTYVPALAQVRDVCKELSDKDAVIWIGGASVILLQPTRGLCGVPTAGTGPLTQEQLAKIAMSIRKKGYRPIVGISANPVTKTYAIEPEDTTLVSNIIIQDYEQTLTRPPSKVVNSNNKVWLSILNEDGSLSPIK